ncbi:MAG: hypothetical protein PHQ17_03540 [Methanobacterium sp.]|jgi:hypothetical protein|nr:hypothetical protein [Methanobacterium sp.]
MKYLICENCEGYYHLKEGESLDDFESCECGGKFYLLEYGEDGQFQSPKIMCESCRNLNEINTPFCSICGQILRPSKEIVSSENNNTFKPRFYASLTFIALSIMILGLFL